MKTKHSSEGDQSWKLPHAVNGLWQWKSNAYETLKHSHQNLNLLMYDNNWGVLVVDKNVSLNLIGYCHY